MESTRLQEVIEDLGRCAGTAWLYDLPGLANNIDGATGQLSRFRDEVTAQVAEMAIDATELRRQLATNEAHIAFLVHENTSLAQRNIRAATMTSRLVGRVAALELEVDLLHRGPRTDGC